MILSIKQSRPAAAMLLRVMHLDAHLITLQADWPWPMHMCACHAYHIRSTSFSICIQFVLDLYM